MSLFVSWTSTLDAVSYDVRILRTSFTRNQDYNNITIEVLSNETEVEYRGLLPEEDYEVCVIGIYSQGQSVFSCRNIQTSATRIPSVSPVSPTLPPVSPTVPPVSLTLPPVSPTVPPPMSDPPPDQTSANLLTVVLGSIIALLVLLLMAAGVGLAYPRCIRKIREHKSSQ